MSYRDDVDTLYTRALTLQRELDAARDELARLRTGRAPTNPGLREQLPEVLDAHERLIDTSDLEELEPAAMPDWAHIVNARMTPAAPSPPRLPGVPPPPPSLPSSRALVERVRTEVAKLGAEDLVLVAKIVAELTDGRGNDTLLRDRLRWLANQLAFGT